MGMKGKEIVGLNVDDLVAALNRALADEWLAYYQYWIGAKVVRGPMKGEVVAELVQHATDELRHADMLVMRILQLGGTPLLRPEDWYTHTNCGYDPPEDPHVRKVLEQNINGERCAIDAYSRLLDMTRDRDPVTHQMALEILRDEVEHEDDLQSILEDLENLRM
jgi:bacterioferritin